jgi:release factor glutamine methyltransferase
MSVTPLSLEALLREAIGQLAASGTQSPAAEARTLLAYVLGCEPAGLLLAPHPDPETIARYAELIDRRATGLPMQHLTGETWFRTVQLAVGPGVFIPRPETEVMTGWALERLAELCRTHPAPLVVELCAGSGAISRAIAAELPGCRQYAVELSAEAYPYLAHNLTDTGVTVVEGDMADALPELDGLVDLVICNPPYVPLDAYEGVTEEVRRHEPPLALFSGPDGLDAMRVLAVAGARLVRPGGLVCAEHAEVQEHSAPAVFVGHGSWDRVRDHRDLNGRPRFVTAVRR